MKNISLISEVIELNKPNLESALLIGYSISQYKRDKQRYKKDGVSGLEHRGTGNKNALKYDDEFKDKIKNAYVAESAIIISKSNGQRGPRKLRVFSRLYNLNYKTNIPYTSCKKILNDAGIESPTSRFNDTYTKNIALINTSNKPISGVEFQGDGSCKYKFPDDDFEVVAHVVVEAAESHLCGVNFQVGECNKGYYYAYRNAFVNVGLPEVNVTDGRGTFFNVNNPDDETTMGKILTSLGVKSITTRNCNRNNKVENAHDPIRDYIWDQMLIDGIRTFEEANEKIQLYIDKYNQVLNHNIPNSNSLRHMSVDEIDNAFILTMTRSMDKKYTIQIDNKKYFIVRNETLLQRKSKTKIRVCTTMSGARYVLYGNNRYELVDATKENLELLKKIDGIIVKSKVRKNGYTFKVKDSIWHAVSSIGEPIKLEHRDTVSVSIIQGVVTKVRTKVGIFKLVEGNANIEVQKVDIVKRKINYKQTIVHNGNEFVLLTSDGIRYIDKVGEEVDIIIVNNKEVSVICKGITYSLCDVRSKPDKYKVPTSYYTARKIFGDLL